MNAENKSPILAILPNSEHMGFAIQAANSLGYESAEIVVNDIETIVAEIDSYNNKGPKYIIYDLGDELDKEKIINNLDVLAGHCPSYCKVVVIGTLNDVEFYRQLRQMGVSEYFNPPANLQDIRSALVSDEDTLNYSENDSKVITFMSSAAGDGGSTIGINTAYLIAEKYKKKTVFVDMDFQFGMVANNLDVSSQYGLRELFENQERAIDSTLVDKMHVKYSNNLYLISAPKELIFMPHINTDTIRDLILSLRENFEYIIIDLPHHWAMWVSAVISEATHKMLVAQLWLKSVTHASRIMGVWEAIGIKKDQINIIVNRHGSKFKEALTVKDLEKISSKKINFTVRNDIKTCTYSENQGKTIAELGDSAILHDYKKIAASIVGTSSSDMEDKKKKKGILEFFN